MTTDTTKTPEVWIFAEQHGNKVAPTVCQLITKARSIAPNFQVVVILLETPDQHLETELAAYGPDRVVIVADPRIQQAADAELASILATLALRYQPNSFLFGATALGRSLAPRVQAKLQTGLTADCLDFRFEGELLIQTKPSYGDNIMCEIVCPKRRPQMATARPNTFAAAKVAPEQICQDFQRITELSWPVVPHFEILKEQLLPQDQAGLAKAKRIVAIGRGAADAASIAAARDLADNLNGQLGVTRPLTDDAQFTVADQIGQSGATVAPELLFCCGISGAVQFLSGITNAKTVVAVNSDAHAAIFAAADFAYVGDAQPFLTALNRRLQN